MERGNREKVIRESVVEETITRLRQTTKTLDVELVGGLPSSQKEAIGAEVAEGLPSELATANHNATTVASAIDRCLGNELEEAQTDEHSIEEEWRATTSIEAPVAAQALVVEHATQGRQPFSGPAEACPCTTGATRRGVIASPVSEFLCMISPPVYPPLSGFRALPEWPASSVRGSPGCSRASRRRSRSGTRAASEQNDDKSGAGPACLAWVRLLQGGASGPFAHSLLCCSR